MPKSKSAKRRIDKYAGNSPQLRDAGFLVKLGGVDEIVHHYRHHFHQFLDYLSIDPTATNWLEHVGDGEPQLRAAMRWAGLTGLTRDELLKKRDKYVAQLEAGEEPYSSKLYGVEWIPAN